MIRLSNPSPIFINPDHIVAFYSINTVTESGVELRSCVILDIDNVCNVVEDVDEIYRKIMQYCWFY